MGKDDSFAPQQDVFEFAFRSLKPQEQHVVSSMLVFAPTVDMSSAVAVQSPTEVPAFSSNPPSANYVADGISSTVLGYVPVPSGFPYGNSFVLFASSKSR